MRRLAASGRHRFSKSARDLEEPRSKLVILESSVLLINRRVLTGVLKRRPGKGAVVAILAHFGVVDEALATDPLAQNLLLTLRWINPELVALLHGCTVRQLNGFSKKKVKQINSTHAHAVFDLKLHIVFVTMYRRRCLSPEVLNYLDGAFSELLRAWRCSMIEFGGEPDHVHMLIGIHPALNISTLMNNLKTASARRARNRFAEQLASFYWKPLFWHSAYFVSSVGGASLETVKAYVERQGTDEHARRKRRG